MADEKGVLAERLACWLNRFLAAGREASGGASSGDDGSADDLGERPLPQKPFLVEHAATVGEIPQCAGHKPREAGGRPGSASVVHACGRICFSREPGGAQEHGSSDCAGSEEVQRGK